MAIGILFGFGMAISFSVAYLFTRSFINRYHSSLYLLIWSHLLIGIACVLMLPLLWTERYEGPIFQDAFQCAFYYLLGQFALFQAVKYSNASRVAPLLGIKIVFIAVLSFFFLDHQFDVLQIMAILVSLAAATLLNWTGGKMPFASIVWVMVSCLFYSLSDIYIKKLVNCFPDVPVLHRSMLAMTIVYLICGAFSVAALPWFRKIHSRKMLKTALPFTVFWFISMILLFGCFDMIGPVFGNLIQSTRGIFSIIIGLFVAKAGYSSIESKVPLRVLLQRLGAAVLMSLAIVMFSWGMKRQDAPVKNKQIQNQFEEPSPD